jgi:hypothetical protein
MSSEKKIWFPAKKYGWGWGPPTCWQGWVVLTVWMVALGAGLFLLPDHPVLYLVHALICSAVLLIICWLKGEKPKWNWGDGSRDGEL